MLRAAPVLLAALLTGPCVAHADVAVWVRSTPDLGASSVEGLPGGEVLYPDKGASRVYQLRQTPPYDGVIRREWVARGADSARRTAASTTLIAETDVNRVIELDADGGLVFSFGAADAGRSCVPTELYFPADAHRLPNGDTLISDCIHHRLLQVQPNGSIAWSYGRADCSSGSNAGELNSPFGIDVLDGGDVLVADDLNHRVLRLAVPSGALRWQYGVTRAAGSGANALNHPLHAMGLAGGNVLISDSSNHRVIEVTPTGANGGDIVWQFGTGDAGAGATQLNLPYHASRLANGHTLIADRGNNRLLEVAALAVGFVSTPELAADACIGPLAFELRDVTDAATAPVFSVELALASDSAGARFFSSESCTTEVQTLLLPGGTRRASFFMRVERADAQTVTVSAAEVQSGSVMLMPASSGPRDLKGWGCTAGPGAAMLLLAVWMLRRRR